MRKKTNEEFIKQLKQINKDVKVLETYKKDNIKILVQCQKCNNRWYATPSNLLRGRGCPICKSKLSTKLRSSNTVEFKEKLKQKHIEIEILDEYINNHTKCRFKCLIHNNIFYNTPHHILSGKTSCKECIAIKYKQGLKSHKQYVEDLRNVNPLVNVLGQYTGAKNKIEVQCVNCGYRWFTEANSLLQGVGCPRCRISKGEDAIEQALQINNITYKIHKTFSNLKGLGGKKLSYDFYLPNHNVLIEYQGIQHYQPVEHFGGIEYFKIQQQHDNLKRKYADDNNIQLIEISYQCFNDIPKIIKKIKNSRIP